MKISARLLVLASLLFFSANASAGFHETYLPENNLHLDKSSATLGGITKIQFQAVIDRAVEIYKPIFDEKGVTLTVNALWTNATVNANASQPSPTQWIVNMYGGLARRAEVSEDGFAMVLCHEIGHHLGGYPFYYGDSWAANEGQSDYFATMACASKVFATNLELSVKAETELPQSVKELCDEHQPLARDICYRSMLAGHSLGTLLGALNGQKVDFATPDKRVVRTTDDAHPQGQCRLDTYMAGALCGPDLWDHFLIPGKDQSNTRSRASQDDAFAHSCSNGKYTDGARPTCWFAPLK